MKPKVADTSASNEQPIQVPTMSFSGLMLTLHSVPHQVPDPLIPEKFSDAVNGGWSARLQAGGFCCTAAAAATFHRL
jgi:hypothetical protein